MTYENLMTNRQLSEWLAKGNGEVSNGIGCTNHYEYLLSCSDDPVANNTFVIRRFGSSEWTIPLKAIYDEDIRRNKT